jgi:hypothetical protein
MWIYFSFGLPLLLATDFGLRLGSADEFHQSVNLPLLPLDLRLLLFDLSVLLFYLSLLLFESVDKRDAQSVVLHAFDFAFLIVSDKQGIDLFHVFRAEADVRRVIGFPSVSNWSQLVDKAQAAAERLKILLVAKRRRAGRDLVVSVPA